MTMDDKTVQLLVNKLMAHVLPSVNRVKEDEIPEMYCERTGSHIYFCASRDYDAGYILELDVPSGGKCVLDIFRNGSQSKRRSFIRWNDGDSKSLAVAHEPGLDLDDEDLISIDKVVDLAYEDIYEILTKK